MTDRPEIFIGLVGAVGSDLNALSKAVERELHSLNYTVHHIKLSQMISDCPNFHYLKNMVGGPEDERIDAYMDAGDIVRSGTKRGDMVALLAVKKIREIRENSGESDVFLNSTAYIFNSFKHPDEVDLIRSIYQGHSIIVSAYSPRNERKEELKKIISTSRSDYNPDTYDSVAEKLINRDQNEPHTSLGQNVRETFHLADIFIDLSNSADYRAQVRRSIELVFQYPFRTPTIDEQGMFFAHSAAVRSSDLSRQVGAVITTNRGVVISMGCNEVPIAGGDAYWEGDQHDKIDNRDHTLGYDPAAKMKSEIIREVFKKLKSGWFNDRKRKRTLEQLVDDALYKKRSPTLKGTRITSILEFGRVVHAEMSAITQAASEGRSVKGAKMYCTTFPCHMCARHIIASGIDCVKFIEPYPKSLAKELYQDSISVDFDVVAQNYAVKFEPFVGIAPRQYMRYFGMKTRKDERGHIVDWQPKSAIPIVDLFPTYIFAEAWEVKRIENFHTTLGFSDKVAKRKKPKRTRRAGAGSGQ